MPPLILDGGMSRELMRIGAPFKQPEWSALSLIEAPHLVKQVHLEFALAGADIIITNSYALVPFHIGEDRFWKDGKELAALSGRLAREAADEVSLKTGRKVRVAGSLPPIFGSYEPEKFDSQRVAKYLDVLVSALEPYVDIWLGETLSLIAEAKAVISATSHTGKPIWISFCPDDSEMAAMAEPRLRSGENIIDDVLHWACDAGIEALLFNCCRPEAMLKAVSRSSEFMPHRAKPVILGAYANAFVPAANERSAANEDVSAVDENLTVTRYAEDALVWKQHGAQIIGGCCGVGVEHIRHLAATIR